FQSYFESYLSVASTVPSVLCVILNFLMVNKISSNTRILTSLAIMLVIFLMTTALVKTDTSSWTKEFFTVTLASVAIVSGASNIFSGSIFGITGRFPMKNSQAVISGQGMGGTVSAVASVVDLAAAGNVTDSAFAYFMTAVVFIFLCIIVYLILPYLQYSKYYLKIPEERVQTAAVISNGSTTEEDIQQNMTTPTQSQNGSSGVIPPLKTILKKNIVLGLCVFYVFMVSIIIFPSISSNIESINKGSGSQWSNKYFAPLTCFLLYNFADFCGRQVTAWIQIPGPKSKFLPTLVVLRTVFIPLFVFCNYQPRDTIKVVFFNQDLYPVIFTILLGLSNGYLGTLPMIYGPKVVPKELSEAAGVGMSFFLMSGLAMGSAFSVLLVHLI
uniref:Solute carrier family 29 member 3 n=1 Tax=Latimeria chalumnae TaxID=7897 RepID=H3AAF7_LATCH